MPTNTPIEIKSATPDDIATAFDDFMRAFEAFKDANDERLGQLERRCRPTSSHEKGRRASTGRSTRRPASVDELALKSARPQLGGAAGRAGAALEHKAAFDAYVRTGEAGSLRELEARRCRSAPIPTAATWCRTRSRRTIGRAAAERLADPRDRRHPPGVGQRLQEAVHDRRPGDRLGRRDRRAPETDTPTLAELSFPAMELYAMPAATATLLDDSAVNIDEWIAEEVEMAFAEQEGTAFVTGDGTNKPKGFLGYTTVANASWTWGKIGYIATGVAGAFASSNPADELIDLVYALKAGYRAERHLRDEPQDAGRDPQAQGRRRQLSLAAAGQGRRRRAADGFPVVEAEDMPDIAANATRSPSAISAAAT